MNLRAAGAGSFGRAFRWNPARFGPELLLVPASSPMRTRFVAVVAASLLVIIFTLDAFTPPTFAYWPYGLPIMLAALTGSRRLTLQLMVAALAANTLGALVDIQGGQMVWTRDYVQDRIVSFVSTTSIGFLTTAAQIASERASRVALLEAQNLRELAVSSAADRILSAISSDRVVATFLAEAMHVFDAGLALWAASETATTVSLARQTAHEVSLEASEMGAALGRLLREAAKSGASVARWMPLSSDFESELRVEAERMLFVPLADPSGVHSFLLVVPRASLSDDGVVASAGSFGRIAASALSEARMRRALASQNDALLERQQIIQDLVDAISHDVRTPLEALSITLGQAIDGAYGALPPDYADVLRESRISIDDIYRLAETLLLVARFEAGTPIAACDRIALATLAEELTAEFRPLAQQRSVELRVQCESAGIVEGSRAHMRRAIANLMANAVHHTPAGGCVEIHVGRRGGNVELTVVDNGFGVQPALRAQLFERFAPGVGGGSGLGLYIVRRVAESIGGIASYEPREPHGSAFRLSLPGAREMAAA